MRVCDVQPCGTRFDMTRWQSVPSIHRPGGALVSRELPAIHRRWSLRMCNLGISSVVQINLRDFFKRRRNVESSLCISTEPNVALFAEMEMVGPGWHKDEIYLWCSSIAREAEVIFTARVIYMMPSPCHHSRVMDSWVASCCIHPF